MKSRSSLMVILSITAGGGTAEVYAQNCSLRNPDRQIYAMFPDATSYQSVVKSITRDTLEEVETVLGSPLRLREIGKHTAYIVLKGTVPVGFVHARSEIGERGALELVWAYDLDLTLRGFEVQRCRERNRDAIKSEAFRENILGSDLEEMLSFLTKNNQGVDLEALDLSKAEESIAHTTMLCGATTRVITEIAFRDPVFNARLLGNVHRFFPDTNRVTKIKLSQGNDGAVGDRSFDPESLVALRTLSAEGQTLGALIFARWTAHPADPELWLGVSVSGGIANAVVVGDVDRETRNEISDLTRKQSPLPPGNAMQPADSPSRCAGDLVAVLRAQGFGE